MCKNFGKVSSILRDRKFSNHLGGGHPKLWLTAGIVQILIRVSRPRWKDRSWWGSFWNPAGISAILLNTLVMFKESFSPICMSEWSRETFWELWRFLLFRRLQAEFISQEMLGKILGARGWFACLCLGDETRGEVGTLSPALQSAITF